jgi:hypothetical protein
MGTLATIRTIRTTANTKSIIKKIDMVLVLNELKRYNKTDIKQQIPNQFMVRVVACKPRY